MYLFTFFFLGTGRVVQPPDIYARHFFYLLHCVICSENRLCRKVRGLICFQFMYITSLLHSPSLTLYSDILNSDKITVRQKAILLAISSDVICLIRKLKRAKRVGKQRSSVDKESEIQLNFNGSNTFGTMKISSRQG